LSKKFEFASGYFDEIWFVSFLNCELPADFAAKIDRVTVRRPPRAPLRHQNEYAHPIESRWGRIKLSVARFFLRRIGMPLDATDMLRSAMKLGNPTITEWPAETLPMNTRLFACGFWNYSFFQFNRKFLPPFWAQEQYNPESTSFIPRSHNILSMNQTQRNWIAIGFPGSNFEASIDMAGGIMPFPGSYTIEFATLENDKLIRPQNKSAEVELSLKSSHRIEAKWRGLTIEYKATRAGFEITARGSKPLLLSVRPFNVEGPALLYKLDYSEKKQHLTGDANLEFESAPDRSLVSNLMAGDALRRIVPQIRKAENGDNVTLEVRDTMGLSTAAFYFARADRLDAFVATDKQQLPAALEGKTAAEITEEYFAEALEADLPKGYSDWLEHAKKHLIALWDFDSIKPGSYTYHHFWIRDAVIMMYALLLVGAHKAVAPIIERLADMVKPSGLFKSQTGEWDANGQALWILAQYAKFTGDTSVLTKQKKQIERMVRWLDRAADQHDGVLPPGFSAEHLGPADWYLWDTFWALGGLKEIAALVQDSAMASRARATYEKLARGLNTYLEAYSYLPAALGRGKDAGMIGSIAAAYPLQISDFADERMRRTLDLIYENYFHQGCFFQENIHSGLNPYLTLQMAESFLFFGETARARQIIRSIKSKAQKGYTFPEAIHVKTGGGCMGDGFHGWASAEAIIMIRNLVAREVRLADGRNAIIWLSGFREKWLTGRALMKNIYTVDGKMSMALEDLELKLAGNLRAVQILSLPQNFTAIESDTRQPLSSIEPRKFSMPLANERVYFELPQNADKIKVTLCKN